MTLSFRFDSTCQSYSLMVQSLTLTPRVQCAMFSTARASSLRQVKAKLQSSRTLGRPHRSAFARLLGSFAILEQRDGALDGSSLSAITAAQKLGGPVTAFIAGSNVQAVAKEAAKVKGLREIITIENSAYDKVHPLRPFRHMASHILIIQGRGFPKVMLLYLLRTLQRQRIHILLRDIRRLVKT